MINLQTAPRWWRMLMSLFAIAFPYWLMRSGLFRFPWTFVVIILFILIWAWVARIRPGQLGFVKIGRPLKWVGSVLLIALLLELLMDWLIQPGINRIFNEVPDYSYFNSLQGDLPRYLRMLAFMLISAAAGEELLFRSFMFYHLEQLLPPGRWRSVLVCLIPALLFGWAHAYEGTAGVVVTGIWGLLFGVIYLRSRNIWLLMAVHACIDIVFLTLAYTGRLSYYELPGRLIWGQY